MCMFDQVNAKKNWRADPEMSLNDNLFFGSVHFAHVFFERYHITRHQNEHDYDDMAADCSIAVYESAKKNIDKWDRNYRLDQYIYYRAWSIVGNWIRAYFERKRKSPLDVKLSDNRLTSVEYDVGTDEIGSSNYGQGLHYVVFKEAPKSYYEKKLSDAALQFLDYKDECEYLGIEPMEPEDFLTNRNSLETDLRYLQKILNAQCPSKTASKKCRAPSMD